MPKGMIKYLQYKEKHIAATKILKPGIKFSSLSNEILQFGIKDRSKRKIFG